MAGNPWRCFTDFELYMEPNRILRAIVSFCLPLLFGGRGSPASFTVGSLTARAQLPGMSHFSLLLPWTRSSCHHSLCCFFSLSPAALDLGGHAKIQISYQLQKWQHLKIPSGITNPLLLKLWALDPAAST